MKTFPLHYYPSLGSSYLQQCTKAFCDPLPYPPNKEHREAEQNGGQTKGFLPPTDFISYVVLQLPDWALFTIRISCKVLVMDACPCLTSQTHTMSGTASVLFEYEMSHISSHIWTHDPQLVMLFGKATEHIRGGTFLGEVRHGASFEVL